MIYLTLQGRAVDTERDLSDAERHVMMKLMLWENLGLEKDEYQRRREDALLNGWNNQGAVSQSAALKAVGDDLAQRLAVRHGARGPGWLRPRLWSGRYAGGGLRPVDGGGMEVLDAADQVRGTVSLNHDDTDEAVRQLERGQGTLAEQIRALGLELRK